MWMPHKGREAEPPCCQRDHTTVKHLHMDQYLQLQARVVNAQVKPELHGP